MTLLQDITSYQEDSFSLVYNRPWVAWQFWTVYFVWCGYLGMKVQENSHELEVIFKLSAMLSYLYKNRETKYIKMNQPQLQIEGQV